MLNAFRSKGLMSAIYGMMIFGMAGVFILEFNPSAGKKTASMEEKCAARVRGRCITPKDHMAAYRIMIPRGQQGELLGAKAKQMGLLRLALDGLIERELLDADADRLGITVTDDEVTDHIYDGFIYVSVPSDDPGLAFALHIPDGRVYAGFRDPKTHRFEMRTYERQIKALVGRSPSEFREEQAREVLASKVRDIVRAPVRVSEMDALASYIDEKSTATLNTIQVRESFVAKFLPPPAAADVDAYLADPANKAALDAAVEEHKTPHIRHILVKVAESASQAEKDAAKARIMKALDRIKHGESFAAVAREVSEDTGSAQHGGDVGDETSGFVKPFKDAADKLKPGEMTQEPVVTQFGYHIIEREPAMTEDQVRRAAATDALAKKAANEKAKAIAEKIQADLKAGKDAQKSIDDETATLAPATPAAPAPKKPAAAASAKSPLTDPDRPQIVATASFNRGGEPLPELSSADAAKVMKFAFSAQDKDGMDDVLKAGDGYVLVSLKEHKTATKDEFDKDKETYMESLVARKQAEALALYVKRLKEAAKGEYSIDEQYLAEKMGTGTAGKDGGAPAAPAEDEDESP